MTDFGFDPTTPVIGGRADLEQRVAQLQDRVDLGPLARSLLPGAGLARPQAAHSRQDLANRYLELKAQVDREMTAAMGGEPRLHLVLMALSAHDAGLADAKFVVDCLRTAFKWGTPVIPSMGARGEAEAALYQAPWPDTASSSEAGG